MRTVLVLLASAAVVLGAADASAQGPGPGGPSQSTGNVSNANQNSSSQFLSGANTGVNNGSLQLDLYSGSEPYQGIIIEGSPSLPQLPGFMPPASNFSQPYKPDTFVNGPVFLPKGMTLAEAKSCRDSKVRWFGSSQAESTSIQLFYTHQKETPAAPMTMANYVGTALATTSDGPFMAALCEAAYKAMNKGGTMGVVDFIIRPKNTMLGVGFGTSGGAAGLPAAGAHPYAIAGTLGFGTGWSNQKVEGEVMVQLTVLRASGAAAITAPDAARRSPAPATGDGSAALVPATPSAEREATAAATTSSTDSAGTGAAGAGGSESARTVPAPADAQPPVASPATAQAAASQVQRVATPAPSPSTASRPAATPSAVLHHPPASVARLERGHPKSRVFDVFPTFYATRNGQVVKVEGLRLRPPRRSPRGTSIEIGEVVVGSPGTPGVTYWLLFENGRLMAWGQPHEWKAAADRYQLDRDLLESGEDARRDQTRIDGGRGGALGAMRQ
jgi:hypothetical protein